MVIQYKSGCISIFTIIYDHSIIKYKTCASIYTRQHTMYHSYIIKHNINIKYYCYIIIPIPRQTLIQKILQ